MSCVVHVERHFGRIDHLSTAKFTRESLPFLIHRNIEVISLVAFSLNCNWIPKIGGSTGRKTMKEKIHVLTETKDLSFIFLSFRPLISAWVCCTVCGAPLSDHSSPFPFSLIDPSPSRLNTLIFPFTLSTCHKSNHCILIDQNNIPLPFPKCGFQRRKIKGRKEPPSLSKTTKFFLVRWNKISASPSQVS